MDFFRLPHLRERGRTTWTWSLFVEDTRLLALKTTANFTTCRAVNHSLRRQATCGMNTLQRGFVPRRQLTHNVIDLDGCVPEVVRSSKGEDFQVLVRWDVCASFPGVVHGGYCSPRYATCRLPVFFTRLSVAYAACGSLCSATVNCLHAWGEVRRGLGGSAVKDSAAPLIQVLFVVAFAWMHK